MLEIWVLLLSEFALFFHLFVIVAHVAVIYSGLLTKLLFRLQFFQFLHDNDTVQNTGTATFTYKIYYCDQFLLN